MRKWTVWIASLIFFVPQRKWLRSLPIYFRLVCLHFWNYIYKYLEILWKLYCTVSMISLIDESTDEWKTVLLADANTTRQAHDQAPPDKNWNKIH